MVDRRLSMKHGVLAVLLATAMAGACSQPAEEPSEPATPAAPTVAERVAFYQNCWNLFNTKAWDQFATCYTANATSDNLDSGMPVARGTDAVVQGAKDFVTAFPDLSGSLQLVVASDQGIAALSLLTGTHTGPLAGGPEPLPATNKPIGMMMGHVVIGDATSSAFSQEFVYTESGTMMAQLGVAPSGGRPLTTSGAAAPVIAIASGSETETANVATVQAQYDAFSAHDIQGVIAPNAEALVFHDLTAPQDLTGAENAAMMEGYFAAFPDVKLTIESIWGAGDYVAARGVFQGTNTGPAPAMGITEPTGKSVNVHFLEFSRLENGKVVENWLIFDSMAFATQLGLMGS